MFMTGNFSVALHDFIETTMFYARKISLDTDIQIVEYHHNQKKDAPSGTALMIKEALSTATSGAIEFISEEKGELKLRLSNGFKVMVCEDNHTVNVIIKYGNKSDYKFCRDYQEAYETILAVENGTLKYEPYGKMDALIKIALSIFAVVIFILGVILMAVAGFIIIAPINSGIMAGFRPFYVYVALFFSGAVILIGANALMYFGKKIYIKTVNSDK